MENSFYYCERNNLEFLAEPFNFFTNIFFLYFAILLFFNKNITNKKFSIILFCIGVGSMLFHSVPNKITALIDIFFIITFIFYYLIVLYYKLNINKYTSYLLSILFILFCYFFGNFYQNSILQSSAFYFPILIHLYFFIKKEGNNYFKKFFWIPILFSISLYLRTIDIKYCTSFNIGTHFLWHILNSVVLYLLVKFIHLMIDRSSPEKPT